MFSWNSPSDITQEERESWFEFSFNPCFRGTRPRTLTPFYSAMLSHQFQSLFSWNSPSDFGKIHAAQYPPSMFQSLFSWNSPSDKNIAWARFAMRFGFNPCFRGTRPRTPAYFTNPRGHLEFQSLFSWNSPSDLCRKSPYGTSKSVSILVFVELALGPWRSR